MRPANAFRVGEGASSRLVVEQARSSPSQTGFRIDHRPTGIRLGGCFAKGGHEQSVRLHLTHPVEPVFLRGKAGHLIRRDREMASSASLSKLSAPQRIHLQGRKDAFTEVSQTEISAMAGNNVGVGGKGGMPNLDQAVESALQRAQMQGASSARPAGDQSIRSRNDDTSAQQQFEGFLNKAPALPGSPLPSLPPQSPELLRKQAPSLAEISGKGKGKEPSTSIAAGPIVSDRSADTHPTEHGDPIARRPIELNSEYWGNRKDYLLATFKGGVMAVSKKTDHMLERVKRKIIENEAFDDEQVEAFNQLFITALRETAGFLVGSSHPVVSSSQDPVAQEIIKLPEEFNVIEILRRCIVPVLQLYESKEGASHGFTAKRHKEYLAHCQHHLHGLTNTIPLFHRQLSQLFAAVNACEMRLLSGQPERTAENTSSASTRERVALSVLHWKTINIILSEKPEWGERFQNIKWREVFSNPDLMKKISNGAYPLLHKSFPNSDDWRKLVEKYRGDRLRVEQAQAALNANDKVPAAAEH